MFWDDLASGCKKAKELGFDAVEVFPPGPEAIDSAMLGALLDDNGLSLAAIGTGAGWVKHKLTLTSPDEATREKSISFIRSIMELAAQFEAPAIIGSMQGRAADNVSKPTALRYLGNALFKLDECATDLGVMLLYEPLNRYETNLINTLAEGVQFLKGMSAQNVKLLADLYHMNIEETNLANALHEAGPYVGHIHFADSNRKAAGLGHTDFTTIIAALKEIGYEGYLSAEVYPLPDSDSAAKQTIE
ncbi:MAG TPA: sugar phosphate isomerase/epimerase family protein, partial [Gemmata sp.]|nr:sugar phosphate isomerase/epimerase family protein [Gemmata sp.]